MLMLTVVFLVVIVVGYLMGSLPFSLWVARAYGVEDIRQHGSGNAGATNVARVCGRQAGQLCLALDLIKGVLPITAIPYAARWVWPMLGTSTMLTTELICWMQVAVAFALVVGHSRSVFLGFQGGKSAATGLACVLGLSPIVGVAAALTAAIVFFTTRIVSSSTLTACVVAPILAFVLKEPLPVQVFIGVAVLYIAARHKANIQRLMAGTENKL